MAHRKKMSLVEISGYAIVFFTVYNVTKIPWMLQTLRDPIGCPFTASPLFKPFGHTKAKIHAGAEFLIPHTILAVLTNTLYAGAMLRHAYHPIFHNRTQCALLLIALHVVHMALIFPWRHHIGTIPTGTSTFLNMMMIVLMPTLSVAHYFTSGNAFMYVAAALFNVAPVLDLTGVAATLLRGMKAKQVKR